MDMKKLFNDLKHIRDSDVVESMNDDKRPYRYLIQEGYVDYYVFQKEYGAVRPLFFRYFLTDEGKQRLDGLLKWFFRKNLGLKED